MRRIALIMSIVAAGVTGCASPQWDPAVIANIAMVTDVPMEKRGVFFGSFAVTPRSDTLRSVSIHIQPLGNPSKDITVFGANKSSNAYFRQPEVDTPERRVWLFSGMLPAGRYEIVESITTYNSEYMDLFKAPVPRPIEFEIRGGESVYLGRWQLAPGPQFVPEPKLAFEGRMRVFFSDAFGEDMQLFSRVRQAHPVPHAAGPVANPIPEAIQSRMKEAR